MPSRLSSTRSAVSSSIRRVWLVHLVAVALVAGWGVPTVQAAVAVAAPAVDAELIYRAAGPGSDPAPLDGAVLTGEVIIELHPGRGSDGIRTVTFSLDGSVVQVENNPPWVLSGNTETVVRTLDTAALAPGAHLVRADIVTAGGTSTVEATFRTGVDDIGPGELAYSLAADYSAPQPLDGAALSGPVAVFVADARDVASVEFALDGEVVRTEYKEPFDLSADTDGRSHLLDTSTLDEGVHRVSADVTTSSGAHSTLTASFSVARTSPTVPEVPEVPTVPGGPVGPGDGTRTLTVAGDQFFLDGVPFDMWGIRTASATHTQAQTDHLIDQLDAYQAHGVNTVAVYYMGSRGANYDPFSRDGKSIDPGHQARMEQIIRAADERGMVVVVGIFYQAAPFGLRDADAVREAVRTVTTALLPYRNVVLNIANEHSSSEYADSAHVFDLRQAEAVVELLRIVESIDPARVAGGGGYDRSKNIAIARSAHTDVLLFDTGLGDTREQLPEYRAFRAAGITKPVVNVEQFGGYTNGFPRGIFPAPLKAKYLGEVATAAAEPGLYTFFHNGPWLQVRPMRYDLGGSGTSASPGIGWYFDAVREARQGG